MKLFITGFLQVFFVAVNTIFITNKFYLGVFLCGWTISFLWSGNVKKVTFGNFDDRMNYAFGAAFGSVIGLIISDLIIKNIHL